MPNFRPQKTQDIQWPNLVSSWIWYYSFTFIYVEFRLSIF